VDALTSGPLMLELDPAQRKLLGALTVTAPKHLGESTLVVDEDNALRPDWRMARIGDVALLGKPADSRSPKRIDCYEVVERSAGGTAFKLDPARLVYSLRWRHNAHPPDFELVLLRDPELWRRWGQWREPAAAHRAAAGPQMRDARQQASRSGATHSRSATSAFRMQSRA
jgi:hypothetical protein